MFEVLLASAPPQVVKPGRLLGSLLTHVLTIGLVADATRAASGDTRLFGAATPVLVLVRPVPFSAAPPKKPLKTRAPSRLVARADVVSPPPKGFKTVVAPEDIPPIPPIDLHEKPFDPRDYTGRGVEGGSADGVVGGTGRVAQRGGGKVLYTAATDDVRFHQAVLISQPEPRYPRMAELNGLSGRVLLRFVIDTTGRVDPGSIEVLENTEEEFVPPARESVARAVFRPARMAGSPVRQLAEQSIRFVVEN